MPKYAEPDDDADWDTSIERYRPSPEVITPDAVLDTASFGPRHPTDADDTDDLDYWDDDDYDPPFPVEPCTHQATATAMLDDMRTAAAQCEEIGGPAREVGRWLHARIRHYVLTTGRSG